MVGARDSMDQTRIAKKTVDSKREGRGKIDVSIIKCLEMYKMIYECSRRRDGGKRQTTEHNERLSRS
jgi:hypothetical protein